MHTTTQHVSFPPFDNMGVANYECDIQKNKLCELSTSKEPKTAEILLFCFNLNWQQHAFWALVYKDLNSYSKLLNDDWSYILESAKHT